MKENQTKWQRFDEMGPFAAIKMGWMDLRAYLPVWERGYRLRNFPESAPGGGFYTRRIPRDGITPTMREQAVQDNKTSKKEREKKRGKGKRNE